MKCMLAIKQVAGKGLQQIKNHSPEILIVAGVTGTVVSAVMACKATLKVNDILEETKETLDVVKEAKETMSDTYSEKDLIRDTAIIYRDVAFKFAKLYGPSVILGSLSIATIFTSNNILRKRTAAAMAAYTAVDKGFKEYRGRVVEQYGEEADYNLLHGIKKETVEKTVTDENGKTKKVKETVDVIDNADGNLYTRYISKSNPYWRDEGGIDYILYYLSQQQSYWNDILRTRGSRLVGLNEVYRSLGFDETKAGMVVGWIYDPYNDAADGDNYIEFHPRLVHMRNDKGELEEMIAVDFNVDGSIYDKL